MKLIDIGIASTTSAMRIIREGATHRSRRIPASRAAVKYKNGWRAGENVVGRQLSCGDSTETGGGRRSGCAEPLSAPARRGGVPGGHGGGTRGQGGGGGEGRGGR